MLPLLSWVALLVLLNFLNLLIQARSQEESPEAINAKVSELESGLRSQVQSRSYGARRNLIKAPLKELDLDITPRLGWVRDTSLAEPEPISEENADIAAAFESSDRRLLIVGEPGSGKTMVAYSLIEHLDKTEGAEGQIPLLVNLSAWEAQENFEAFLVDYLCSSVGYRVSLRSVAAMFIGSLQYSLVLDGLDEIPAPLREHFAERLDEFVGGLPSEVAVVVTCRTQEYEQLRCQYRSDGLGLVQAVEILPLTSQQLDRAFAELAKLDKDWETFLSQGHVRAHQRVRTFLSNPLFLNLAVVGHLSPGQLLDWTTTQQELRGLVLESYIHSTLADQRQYEPAKAHRYLTWVARFLDGAEVSPFGLKTSDPIVFDLTNLTPPEPPRWYRMCAGLFYGMVVGTLLGAFLGLLYQQIGGLFQGLFQGLFWGLVVGLLWELSATLLRRWTSKRSALSSRLTIVLPLTSQRRRAFLRRAGAGLIVVMVVVMVVLTVMQMSWGTLHAVVGERQRLSGVLLATQLRYGLENGAFIGLTLGLPLGLLYGLVETRPVFIIAQTPTEARSRSLITALLYVLLLGLVFSLMLGLRGGLIVALSVGLIFGLFLGLNNGGWFVVLQRIAHRRLTRAGKLPSHSGNFLEWGIEKQIFRRVGSGVRFRHNLIQQHLASTSENV